MSTIASREARSLRARTRPLLVAALLALVAFTACGSLTDRVNREITVHVPAACAQLCPPAPAACVPDQAYSIFRAGGDFSASPIAPSDGLYLADKGATLASLPIETRSITLEISRPIGAGPKAWTGLTLVNSTEGGVDVLVLPTAKTCPLKQNIERTSATLGAFDDHHVLIVGGGPSMSVPHSFVADLTTGRVVQLQFGLKTIRENPTVTAFGDGALVAGGNNPDTKAPIDTAEVYQAAVGDFSATTIVLSQPRANHGAVVLANGKTLLVGGSDSSGLPLRTMEIVDPKEGRVFTQGVELLEVPRLNPTVLRLASGEILVAGGFTPGGTQIGGSSAPVPVSRLEWLTPDASGHSKPSRDLVARRNRGFVALDAGGALAVVAPDTTDVADSNFQTTWVISGEGALEPGEPIPGLKNSPLALFRGTSGQPMLFTGAHWLRYEPWFGAFLTLEDAPHDGPPLGLGPSTQVPLATVGVSPDRGLAMWLANGDDAAQHIFGYRFGTMHPFADIPRTLLTQNASYFALDRAPSDISRFNPATGLKLATGATAMLTDVTFASFALDLSSPSGAAPLVLLRDDAGNEVEIGGAACPLLVGSHVHVERHGEQITTSVDQSEQRPCPVHLDPQVRLHVGVRGGAADESYVTSFSIERLGK